MRYDGGAECGPLRAQDFKPRSENRCMSENTGAPAPPPAPRCPHVAHSACPEGRSGALVSQPPRRSSCPWTLISSVPLVAPTVTVNQDGTVETNWDEVIESFDDMGLKEDLLRGIYSYGFEKPSAIQQRAIKPLMLMRDTIAQAQSGTGKTATFTIGERRTNACLALRWLSLLCDAALPLPCRAFPMAPSTRYRGGRRAERSVCPLHATCACAGLLQNIDLNNRDCQALILAPTRELASQIVKVVMAIGDYLGVSTMACIGGTNVRQDMDKLRSGVQLVVGTPGRVFDMINRRALAVDYIHYFVLDEVRQPR